MAYATIAKQQWGSGNAATAITPSATTTPTGMLSSPSVYAGLQEGMTQQDRGDGTYDILYNGQSLGTGYKDVRSAISEIGYTNATKKSYEKDGKYYSPYFTIARQAWQDESGNEVTAFDNGEGGTFRPDDIFSNSSPGAQEYNGKNYSYNTIQEDTAYGSQDELNNALRGYTQHTANGGGIIGDWETLGQVLNGTARPVVQREGYMTNSGAAEEIKGTNTLYGSTPVFSKGEDGTYGLLGYRTDLTPGEKYDGGDTQWTDSSVTAKHDGDKAAWQSNVWREIADPDWWKANAVMSEDGTAFVSADKVNDIAGWKNKDAYGYQGKDKGGLFGTIFDALDPILDKTMPFHNKMQDGVTKILGKDSQKETFTTVAPIVLSIVSAGLASGAAAGAGAAAGTTTGQLVGYGLTGLNVANSASKGDWLGAVTTALGTGLSSGAFSDALSSIGTGASELASSMGMSAEMQSAASAAAKGFMNGDLKAMTGGAIDLGSANKVVGSAVRNAVKSAALAGVTGAELEDVMKTALVSGISSLVGGTVGNLTDSNLAGSVAGAAANQGIKNELKDAPAGSSGSTSATTTPTSPQSSTSKTYATIAKQSWR
jgi:hypothetical protein